LRGNAAHQRIGYKGLRFKRLKYVRHYYKYSIQ